jgi:hypothetical protein
MAQLPLNQYKTITGVVSTTNEILYNTRTGYTSIVLYAQVANTGSGIGTVSFYHERTNRVGVSTITTEIVNNAIVPPNDALILLDGKLVLEKTANVSDRIRLVGIGTTVTSSTTGGNQVPMKYTVSILETLNQ